MIIFFLWLISACIDYCDFVYIWQLKEYRLDRFRDFLKACEADSRGRTGSSDCPTPAADLMLKVLNAASSVDAGAVAMACVEAEKIKIRVFEARLAAIQAMR